MASALDVIVNFTGNAAGAIKAADDTERAYDKMASKLESVGKKLSLAVTLPLAAAGVAAIKELESAGKVAAQTDAVIKSTGGAANVTAKQVDTLASSLADMAGVDDEAVKAGENMLLTFTNVHNEAGKGNDVFNQATKAALDLSVAFGKDMTDSSILVGKALNDPIKGVTALQKIGVTFNDTQKETIKAMVESGDVMGAQKVILAELNKEVGGSAEAYGETLAGQVNRAKETLANTSAQIVSVFAPAIELAGNVVKGLADFLGGLPVPVQQAIGAFGLLVAAIGPVLTIIGNIGKIASAVHTGIEAMVTAFTSLQVVAAAANTSLLEIAGTFALGVLAAAAFVAAVVGIGYGLKAIGEAIFGAEESFDGVFEALDRGKQKGKEFSDAIIAGANASANPVEELRVRLNTLRVSMDTAAAAAQAGKLTDEQRAETYGTLHTAITRTKDALEQAKTAAAEEAAANAATKQSLDDAATAANGFANATNNQLSALTAVANATLAAEGGAVGYAAAQLNVEAAQKRVDDLIAGGSLPTSLEYRQATNQLEQANIQASAAAVKMGEDNQTLANILKDQGVSGLVTFRQQLVNTIAASGDASGALQRQVEKVDALIYANSQVQPSVHTEYTAHTEEALRKARELDAAANDASRPRELIITVSADIGAAARSVGSIFNGAFGGSHAVAGGPAAPAGLAIVPTGAAVAPTATGGSFGGGGGSGRTFNINVRVAPGTAPADVGAKVVDSIRAYERVNGRSWRN